MSSAAQSLSLGWSTAPADIAQTGVILGVALSLIALLAYGRRVVRWVRPRWADFAADVRASRDALLGRDAIVDSITKKEIAPALPGIGVRMEHQEQRALRQEERTEVIAGTLVKLVDQHERLIGLTERVNGIDDRVLKLEQAAVERIVGKAESAEAWRAVQAVAGQQPADAPPLERPTLDDA
jgi:hypothetical protein